MDAISPGEDALYRERASLVTRMFGHGLSADESARKSEIEVQLDRYAAARLSADPMWVALESSHLASRPGSS